MTREEFDSLPVSERRKLLAADVLKYLGYGTNFDEAVLAARTGNFMELAGDYELEERPLNEFIQQNGCYVCAKGALFVSWVLNFNHYKVKDLDSISEDCPADELIEIFGTTLLDCIEAAFEEDWFSWHENREVSDQYIGKFKGEGLSGHEKMQAIMREIAATGDLTPIFKEEYLDK